MPATNLSKLKVSLTKHNAHKLATLLKKYKTDEVLDHLDEVRAEKAQSHKNLSVQDDNKLPEVWSVAKSLGDDAIDGLVLVGIIFSHHALIEAMKNRSSRAPYTGRIERGKQLKGKEYTNFARIVDQLGYATELGPSGFAFSLRGLFSIMGLGPLVQSLLGLKLRAAGWDKSNTIYSEAKALGFHEVFGISASEFGAWLSKGVAPISDESAIPIKDQEFFQAADEGASRTPFAFRPGHVERATDPIRRKGSPRTRANQLHNEIQNGLYVFFKEALGEKNVGTELETGCGTSVDLATKESGSIIFYEIKTCPSVRTSIRQAIPQLLEYAFWPHEKRADRLVIVSHRPLTKDAKRYLEHLHESFEVPISYQQYSLKQKKLLPSR